ncbi:hypothetical protein BX666DRAFT_2116849 [Dichotomocladium elegans]|nr:hypothetical protein BX666DRAFT_2116849 [Dichotomocladium elegans]
MVFGYDGPVMAKDYDTLTDDSWLNDTILDFHMEYLEREKIPSEMKSRILLLRPGMVELIVHVQDASHLSAALPQHLTTADAIFIPVNDSRPLAAYSGSHWSLMLYLRQHNTFYYYDSMGTSNIQEAQFTCGRLIPWLGIHHQPAIQPMETPQQTNSADCGIYVIAITDNLVQRLIETQGHVSPDRLTRLSRKDIKVKYIRKELRRLIKGLPPIK